MLIYKDIISGDEVLTDVYKIKEVGGVLYEVEAKHTVESTDVSDAAIGGNPSAEGGEEEGGEASSVSGVNIVIANRLVETSFTKKSYQTHIKEYLKSVVVKLTEANPERVDVFKKQAHDEVKKILGEFKDWKFYNGVSVNPDSMAILLNYRKDEKGVEKPFLLYWKDGLEEEKV